MTRPRQLTAAASTAFRFGLALPVLMASAAALTGCSGQVADQVQSAAGQAQVVVEEAQTAADWQKDMDRLRALGAAYHACIDSAGKGPANWQELKQAGNQAPGLQELESEGWVVAWGKHFRDAVQGTSEYVLAYSPSGLEADGFVLLMDGAVTRLTPDELKAKLAAQEGPVATP